MKDNIEKYLDEKGIKKAFAEHLMKYRGYSSKEAEMAVSDFPDPYSLPYLCEEYLGEVVINGRKYEKRASYTHFCRCGIMDLPMFRYYTFYDIEDVEGHTVGEYRNARKLYQAEVIDLSDFPKE